MLLTIFYAVLIVITVVSMCIAMARRFQQSNFYYPIMFVMMGISKGGYLALTCSQTLDKALLAHKIFDISGCFLMPLIFLCVLELCNINLPFLIRMLLISFNMGIYFLDLSVGHSTLFYASTEIILRDGYTHFDYTVGPLYFLFPLQLICYTLAILGITIHHMRRQKSVSYKNLAYILTMIIATLFIYLTKLIFKYEINSPFSEKCSRSY